jgi:hypothetical protein
MRSKTGPRNEERETRNEKTQQQKNPRIAAGANYWYVEEVPIKLYLPV